MSDLFGHPVVVPTPTIEFDIHEIRSGRWAGMWLLSWISARASGSSICETLDVLARRRAAIEARGQL